MHCCVKMSHNRIVLSKDDDASMPYRETTHPYTSFVCSRKMAIFMNVATLQGHTNAVFGCDISRDEILASTSWDKTVRLWDMNTQQCINVLNGHAGRCQRCCFTADGTLLASTSDDKTVRLWDMRTRHSIATLQDSNCSTYQCSFSSDGSWIAAACIDARVARVWDVKTLRCIATLNHGCKVWTCSFSADGTIAPAGDASEHNPHSCVVHLWK